MVYRLINRPKNTRARVGWPHTIATGTYTWSMQVGTPVHGRANLVHVKTGTYEQTLVYTKTQYCT